MSGAVGGQRFPSPEKAGGVKRVQQGRMQRAGPARRLPTKSQRFQKAEPDHVYPRLGLADIYVRQCKALYLKPNSQLLSILPSAPGQFGGLQELQADANYLGDRGCVAVAEVLRVAHNLQSVRLSQNGLTDKGLDLMLPVLGSHPKLTALDLHGNKLTQQTMGGLRALFKQNTRLVHLRLDGNPNFYEAGISEIATLAAANQKRADGTAASAEGKEAAAEQALSTVMGQWATPGPDPVERREGLADFLKESGKTVRAPARNMDGWATVNVFVSCTFTDFVTELHVINNKVIPELNRRLRRHKIMLSAIDLHQSRQYNCDNIENMMNVKYVLGTVRQSCDIFLGLHGETLGWLPASTEIPDYGVYDKVRELAQKEPLSITYLQFLEGWHLRRGGLNTPLGFFYFRNPNVVLSVPEAVRSQVMDSAQRRRVCSTERRRLLDLIPPHLVYKGYGGHFKTIDRHGAVQLCRMRDFEETAQLDLFNAVASMFDLGPGAGGKAACSGQETLSRAVFASAGKRREGGPFSESMDSYFEPAADVWQGRGDELAALRKLVAEEPADAHAAPRLVVLTGPRGCGLTAAIDALYRDLRKYHSASVMPLRHYCGLSSLCPEANDPRGLFRNLLYQSLCPPGGQQTEPPPTLEAGVMGAATPGAASVGFWHHLQDVARATKRRVAVLVDDCASLLAPRASGCFGWISSRSRVPAAARVVVTVPHSRPDLIEAARLVDPRLEVVEIGPLLLKERRQIVPKLLEPHRLYLPEAMINGEIIRREDASQPLYLYTLCHALLHRTGVNTPAQELKRLPRTQAGLLDWLLKAKEAKEGNAGGSLHFVRFLSLLCCSRTGLTAFEARQLLVKPFHIMDKRRDRGVLCEEDYVAGLVDSGYASDAGESDRHAREHRATRARLWARWVQCPRLLPGSIWSRVSFEARPFVQRLCAREQCSPIDTHVYAFAGATFRDSCAERYMTSRRRRARIHAQLAVFYRSKAYVTGGPLSAKGMREAIYHFAKAWLWDSLVRQCLHPVWVYHILREGMLYELTRDLDLAEAELDVCIAAHSGRNSTVHSRLLWRHHTLVEYASWLSGCGEALLSRCPALVFALASNCGQQSALAAHARDFLGASKTLHLTAATRSFYSARTELLHSESPHRQRAGAEEQSPDGVPHLAPSAVVGVAVSHRWVATWMRSASAHTASSELLRPGVVAVWDAATGERVSKLQACADDHHVSVCSFSLDCSQLAAVSSEGGSVVAWTVPDGVRRATLRLPPRGSQLAVTHGCAFSPVAPAVRPGETPELAQIRTQRLTFDSLHRQSVMCWDTMGRVLLWESSAEPRPQVLSHSSASVSSASFSPAGAKIVVAADDARCTVYAAAGGSEISAIGTQVPPRYTAFVQNSSRCVVTVTDRRVVLWGADDGAELGEVSLDLPTSCPITAVGYSPSTGLLSVLSPTHRLWRWSVTVDDAEDPSITGERGMLFTDASWAPLLQAESVAWAVGSEYVVGAGANGLAMAACVDSGRPGETLFGVADRQVAGSGCSAVSDIITDTQDRRLLPLGGTAAAGDSNVFFVADLSSGVPMRLVAQGTKAQLPVSDEVIDTGLL
eukprot:TRINITY_DN14527_c0_g1_i2.p1 TRINITY_DN14527_c0_g1~~TRINITY_DN14527_c0_g1_i2.p1  ORF type:complete len:1586 (+),score=446.24 TRINITY_DN14527_c0_g1_i2:69-4826(+)